MYELGLNQELLPMFSSVLRKAAMLLQRDLFSKLTERHFQLHSPMQKVLPKRVLQANITPETLHLIDHAGVEIGSQNSLPGLLEVSIASDLAEGGVHKLVSLCPFPHIDTL